jgi:photosystem II stability/assembly factor-like uncharacterized protein
VFLWYASIQKIIEFFTRKELSAVSYSTQRTDVPGNRVNLMVKCIITACILQLTPAESADPSDYLLHCAVLFSRPQEVTPLGMADPARSVGLFRRDENGKWRNIHHPNVFSYGLGYSVTDNVYRLYLAGGNGLHRSSDDGMTWRVLTGWQTEDILSVAPHPVDSTVIYVSTPFGVFKTTNDGVTWQRMMQGMKRWFVQKVKIAHQSPDILYAAAEDDAYRSEDGGENWVPLSVGVSGVLEITQHHLNTEILFAGTEDYGIFVSHDGGKIWFFGAGIPQTAIYTIGVTPDGNRIYAGGYRTGVWYSDDLGKTWECVWNDETIEAIYALTVHPLDDTHILIGTNGNGLYESVDSGISWNHAGLFGAHVQQILFVPKQE